MKLRMTHRSALLLTLMAGLVVGGVTGHRMNLVPEAAAQTAAADATPLQIPDPVQLSTAFSKLAKQLEPSVVLVTSTIEQKAAQQKRGGRQNQEAPESPDDLFRRFFGQDPFGDQPQQPRNFRSQGTGSGFIVDTKGYILTNNHVVDGATKVQVKLHNDPTEYTAKVIGTDPELDLAVLKITPDKPLVAVKLGNSDAVEVGDWAVAIGSPFGLETTVTAGIVSALGRDLYNPGHQLQRFLQTDAAINPGNSGGPLLNIRGEVVGVNTMIATSSGASAGVGFALPMNMAVNAYNQIIKTGKVSRGAIGIQFRRDKNPALLKGYGGTEGVFVYEVTKGTPAARAGLQEGDIITAFNGKPVKDGDELVNLVSETPVGTKAPLTVLRDRKTLHLTIEVADRATIIAGDTRGSRTEGGSDRGEGQEAAKFGIKTQSLRAQDREEMDLSGDSGVLVSAVDDGSFAEDIGMVEGDVLISINREPVNSPDDVQRIAGKLKAGDAVAFKVLRGVRAAGRRSQGNTQGGGSWQALFLAGTLPAAQ
jgi:serine protease Do